MLQFDITLKCGQPSVKRLTWLKNTIYKLVFHIIDTDGTPLDTVESWKGRIAEAWIGSNKIFYTSNPAHLNTQQFIIDSAAIDLKFGGDKWALQLIASDQPMQIVPSQGELPNNISCDVLNANHSISCADWIFAPRVQTNYLQVFEAGDVARPGWLETPNVDVKQLFIDEAMKNTGLTLLRGKTEIENAEVTTCDSPTIVNMRGARLVMDANTRIYCPISPKDGGEVYYQVTPMWSEDLGGYVLAFMRATES